MARDESNREDLLREATALIERVELVPRPTGIHLVAGFRRDGELSIFFGEDPVYQFNAAGELRRAYRNGVLLKATNGRLASLNRVRTEREVQLVRTDLSDSEQGVFLDQMAANLRQLKEWIRHGEIEVVGQVPADADVLGRVGNWLSEHSSWEIATRPNA